MKKKKTSVAKSSRAKAPAPQIFVRTLEENPPRFARASIRVKTGEYCYLVWRDGEHVRNFYLGRKRKS